MLSSRVAELNLRGLKLEVVGLRDRLDGDGAGVVLRKDVRLANKLCELTSGVNNKMGSWIHIQKW